MASVIEKFMPTSTAKMLPGAKKLMDKITKQIQEKQLAEAGINKTYTYEESLAKAQERASPIVQALTAREEYLKPIESAKAFSPVAGRGFGDSGLAQTAVGQALSELRFDTEKQQQTAVSNALNQIQGEQQQEFNQAVQRMNILQTQESNDLQRRSQQDKGLFS